MSMSECARILRNIEKDASWLVERLEHLSYSFPESKQYREKNDVELLVATLGPDIDHIPEMPRGPNPVFYYMFTLVLFPNLQRLSASSMPRLGPQITLPWLIKLDRGQSLFQQLEELILDDVAYTTISEISSS